MNIGGGGGYETAPMAMGGGGGGLGAIAANVVFSLFLFAMLWIPMACLYPMTALAGMATGFTVGPILARILPRDFANVAFVIGFVAGLIVVLVVFRIEYRLAEQPAFRRLRHGVRMFLLALWAIPIIQLSSGVTAPSTSTRFILGMMTSPVLLASWLINPIHLVLWLAALAGLHYLIWSGERFRTWWHRRLLFLGLK